MGWDWVVMFSEGTMVGKGKGESEELGRRRKKGRWLVGNGKGNGGPR